MPRLRTLTRTVLRWLARLLLAAVIASVLAVTAMRWLAPPFTSFMAQKTVAALWRGDPDFRFRHTWVEWSAISPHAKLAAIAAEDQRFPDHSGFDLDAMRAAWEGNRAGARIRGGSTISQQLAKNLFLWPDRSYVRKGLEAYFTALIEAIWPKRRILEVYLNVVEFGPGIFGIEAAAQAYFGKPAARLDMAEAALLAATLPNPLRYRVDRPSAYVRERQAWIMWQMAQLGQETLRRIG